MGCHLRWSAKRWCLRLGACLFLASGASVALADNTTLLICDQDNGVDNVRFEAPYYSEEGETHRLLVVAGEAEASGCSREVLDGVSADQLLWAGPADPDLDDDGLDSLILQGQFDEEVRVSEVLSNRPLSEPPRSYLPFNHTALPYFEPQVFGVEERVDLGESDQLACKPGENVAGVFYRSERRWLAQSPMTLVLEAQGEGAFQVAIGDSQRDHEQEPMTLGSMVLDGNGEQTFRFQVPDNEELWSSLTIVCPREGATLHIDDLRMEPIQGASNGRAGAWFWSPAFWQERPQALWDAASEQGLEELYLSVPVEDGQVADPDALADFLVDAEARDLSVWVVIGDPRDVLEQSWPALEDRLKAFRRFNEDHADDAQLDGVQLDIEPYLLPGFSQNHELWRERYVRTIELAEDVMDEAMPLDLVVPSWWGIHPRWGERFFEALSWSGMRMTVMNYHTDPERLKHDAEPFLSWGQNTGSRIRMALEAGGLPDETQQRFTRASGEGELWRVDVGQASVLMLFDRPKSGLPGTGFSHEGTATVPASRYTFDGDLDTMAVVAGALEAHWQKWTSFDGLSFHGLDETYTGKDRDE